MSECLAQSQEEGWKPKTRRRGGGGGEGEMAGNKRGETADGGGRKQIGAITPLTLKWGRGGVSKQMSRVK